MKIRNTLLVGFIATLSLACMTSGKQATLSKNEIKKRFQTSSRKPAATTSEIPRFADGSTSPSLESQLGNLLLEKPRGAVISVPAVIEQSGYNPFGDGQTNAKQRSGSWTKPGFPVIGLQTGSGASAKRTYLFDPSLGIKDYKESSPGGSWYKVQPAGWEKSFYFSFDTETLPVSEFLKGIPASIRTFAGGRVAPDLARIGKTRGIEALKNLGAGYNVDPYPDTSVHGVFPNKEGEKTALGGVLTWGVTDRAFGPFKNLYTCFEARNFEGEKKFGVPSGAGWHHIGDAAETLLNTLSSFAIPVAVARTHHFNDASFDSTESITATWLQPDEVFLTRQGEFHWYLNPYPEAVCTEIWVQNCVPNLTNNWGFRCE